MMNGLEITTYVGCVSNCIYCPQDKFIKAYGKRSNVSMMRFDMFKRCIDKVPKHTHIKFKGFTEPWSNPLCTDMILYAHQCGFPIEVSTTLMGMELQDICRFKDVPFKIFAVHLPDNRKQTHIKVDRKYLDVFIELIETGISNLHCHLHGGNSMRESIHHKLKPVLEKYKVHVEDRWLITRAGNINIKGKSPPDKIAEKLIECPRLYSNNLLPDGEVVLCCMDWNLDHVLGNLSASDYEVLFYGEEFTRILKGLEDASVNLLCRKCEMARTVKKDAAHRLKNFIKKSILE